MNDTTVMQQALDALITAVPCTSEQAKQQADAIVALRAAITSSAPAEPRVSNEQWDALNKANDQLGKITASRLERSARLGLSAAPVVTTSEGNDFDLRGQLAGALTCWHRLTKAEADNLLMFVRGLKAQPVQPATFELPKIRETDGWEAARIGDYNNGFNDCLAQVKTVLASSAPAEPAYPVEPVSQYGSPAMQALILEKLTAQPAEPVDKAVFKGRLAFYLEQIKDPRNHEAIAFDLAYSRAALAQPATPTAQPVQPAQPAAPVVPTLPIELTGIANEVAEGSGFWCSCSGCHELNEGHSTGSYSEVFKCALGNGCSECGGIGAVWDNADYEAKADFIKTPNEATPVVPADQPPQGAAPAQAASEPVAAAPSIPLLAKLHTGMRVDYSGLIKHCCQGLGDSANAEMLRQLGGHLQELGARWYSGDVAVVDEILQLYCIEKEARAKVSAAPTEPAKGGAA